MKIANNTHYFCYMSKTFNVVPDNDSFAFESAKRNGYAQRLYWEFQYTKKMKGQAYFWTFTYNDSNLPVQRLYINTHKLDDKGQDIYTFKDITTFDYNHVRLLTNGLISKELKRKYGSKLRYFCACERGEGKGSRGKGNNPHYHIIFFITPHDKPSKSDKPYRRISPYAFAELVKKVWQYNTIKDSYKREIADYKSARFGHAQPGQDMGLVTCSDALSYCAKYCIKDCVENDYNSEVYNCFRDQVRKAGITYDVLDSYYTIHSWVNDLALSDYADMLALHDYNHWRKVTGYVDKSYMHYLETYNVPVLDWLKENIVPFFNDYYIDAKSKALFHEWRNRYGLKTRCSKSLGAYGLEFIQSPKEDPYFNIATSSQMKAERISLYYFRKKYMDVVTCPVSGNPLYVLNGDGVALKRKQLPKAIDNTCSQVHSALELYSKQNDHFEFTCMRNSTILPFDTILKSINEDVIRRYAIYRHVYQYRSYMYDSPMSVDTERLFIEDVLEDYTRFITECNIYTCDYDNNLTLYLKQDHDCKLFSYDNHPAFAPYIKQFQVLELLINSYVKILSDGKKAKFNETASLKQKLNCIKFNGL